MLRKSLANRKAQTALEYLLILALVAAIVFVGFKTLLPNTQASANAFFNAVSRGIVGEPPP